LRPVAIVLCCNTWGFGTKSQFSCLGPFLLFWQMVISVLLADIDQKSFQSGSADQHPAKHLISSDQTDFDPFRYFTDFQAGRDDVSFLTVSAAGAGPCASDQFRDHGCMDIRLFFPRDDVKSYTMSTDQLDRFDVDRAGPGARIDLGFDTFNVPVRQCNQFTSSDDRFGIQIISIPVLDPLLHFNSLGLKHLAGIIVAKPCLNTSQPVLHVLHGCSELFLFFA